MLQKLRVVRLGSDPTSDSKTHTFSIMPSIASYIQSDFSEPQFSHLYIRDNITYLMGLLWE